MSENYNDIYGWIKSVGIILYKYIYICILYIYLFCYDYYKI